MKMAAQAANMPLGFIEGIEIERVDDHHWKIVNNWTNDNGDPLATWFEYGTDRHWIEPKDPDGFLVWESKGPESGHSKAIYSKRADNYEGKLLFSKGHYVTGLPDLEPMARGFKIGVELERSRRGGIETGNPDARTTQLGL